MMILHPDGYEHIPILSFVALLNSLALRLGLRKHVLCSAGCSICSRILPYSRPSADSLATG